MKEVSMKRIVTNILFYIMGWAGSKLFQYMDMYVPKKNVEGITFTNNEKYLNKVSEIELE